MTIGIDIDDTITNTSLLVQEVMKNNNIVDYKGDYNNLTDEEMLKYKDIFINNIDQVLTNCSLKENVSSVLKKLHDNGNKIILITSRDNYFSPNVYNITIDYLEKNNIIYDELFFECNDKAKVCFDKKVDIMIDDNIKLYNKLVNSKTKPILFETDYNKEFDCLKINNWESLFSIIGG